jgi:hypothetical protein
MSPRLFATVLLVILFATAYSQRLEPGFIISTNGDTIKGFVPERSLLRGYKSVKFTPDINQPLRKYGPSEVNGFGGETGLFESREVTDGKSNAKRQVFAKLLISGPLRLYKFDERNFAIASDSLPEPKSLRNKNYLYFYVKNCLQLTARVKKVRNDEDSQIDFFKKLYECLNVPYKVNLRPVKPAYSNYFAELGYGISTLSFRPKSSGINFSNVTFNESMAPVGGVGFERYLATRRQQRFSFYFSILATKNLLQGQASESSGSDFNFENVVFDYYSINLSIIGKKDVVVTGKSRLSIGLGIIGQQNILQKGLWMKDTGSGQSITTRTEDIDIFSKKMIGLSGVVGLKKFIAERPFTINVRPAWLIGDRSNLLSGALIAGIGLNKSNGK